MLWYQLHVWGIHFQVHGGGNHPPLFPPFFPSPSPSFLFLLPPPFLLLFPFPPSLSFSPSTLAPFLPPKGYVCRGTAGGGTVKRKFPIFPWFSSFLSNFILSPIFAHFLGWGRQGVLCPHPHKQTIKQINKSEHDDSCKCHTFDVLFWALTPKDPIN